MKMTVNGQDATVKAIQCSACSMCCGRLRDDRNEEGWAKASRRLTVLIDGVAVSRLVRSRKPKAAV